MAIGETAALVASLELKSDKFTKGISNAERSLAGLERQTSTLGRIGSEATRGLQSTVTNLTKIGIVAGGVIAHSVVQGVQSIQRLEEVTVATNTVLESTGGIAGQTAEDIRNLAEKYEGLNATIDDKVIQSAENLLLTFTNITDQAFEPALEAALNLNQAMGGGEEGLQSTIIQVGKALNDPIRGVGQLRRLGVQLTEQQEDQIRTLVEQNDLYGAQQVILGELTTQFGDQFAKAGDTATGKMAKFRDAVEDAQMSLATAFLPVLEKVADKATTFLSDPEVQAQIGEFGEGLADAFDQAVEFAGKIPWGTIGESLKIAGAGAKLLLDAFTSLPDWVQTAVITGWGLNKLTGGALGNIGKIAIDLFKNRGSTPANPLFTKEVGLPGVGGGAPATGVPAAAAGSGALAGAAALGAGIALPFLMFNVLPELFKVQGAKPVSAQSTIDGVTVKLDPQTTAMMTGLMPGFQAAVQDVGGEIVESTDRVFAGVFGVEEALDETRAEVRDLNDPLEALQRIGQEQKATVAAGAAAMQARLDTARAAIVDTSSAVRTTAANTATQLARVEAVERGTQAYTAQVAAKDFSPSFNNTTNVGINASFVISATSISRTLQIQQSATQTTFSGRGGDQRF